MTEPEAKQAEPFVAIPLCDVFLQQPPLREGGTPAVMSRVFSRDCLNTSAASRMDLDPSVACSPCSQLEGNPVPVTLANVPLRSIRFIRLPEVMSRTALSKMTIRRWEREGAFPHRRKIGKNVVAWIEAEIDDWCEKRASGEPWGGER